MKSLRFSTSFVILLAALAFGSLAQAQATRTWVSGVGDDANPCSRTAPCKTFAGAISKTLAAGEIDCLDSGGFGALTITKPITLDCGSGVGSILVAGTNGLVISSSGAADAITIRNLDIEGLGSGLSGILILTANSVHLENVRIHDFNVAGIQVNATTTVNVSMNNVTITADNPTGIGMTMTTTTGVASAELDNVRIWNTHPALQAKVNSAWTVHDSDLSFNGVAVKGLQAGAVMHLINCQVNYNTIGVESIAGTTIYVMQSSLSQNATAFSPNGGGLLSDGVNNLNGNTANGTVTGATTRL